MKKILRRDYFLLLLTSALTAIVLVGAAEVGARVLFPEQVKDSCQPTKGGFIPNCTSMQKVAEGPAVVNHYNACGYRTPQPCGPKPSGTIRVAVIGTSISRGYAVAYKDSFAAKASLDLAKRCGRPVEFQNLAIMWNLQTDGPSWEEFEPRVDEGLGLNPDLVLFVVAPWDIWKYRDPTVETSLDAPGAATARKYVSLPFYAELHAVADNFRQLREASRSVLILRHIVDTDPDTYISQYLKDEDESDYLRTPFTAAWRSRLQFLDTRIAALASKAQAKQIPAAVMFVPFAPQAILAGRADPGPNLDPRAIDRAIGSSASKHDLQYIDTVPAMSAVERPTDLYYLVNGHPNAAGHALLAKTLVAALLQNPAFAGCVSSEAQVRG